MRTDQNINPRESSARYQSTVELLRSSTSILHKRIESNRLISKFFDDADGVGRLVGRWYGFFVPFERQLQQIIGPDRLDLASRSKVPSLVSDLAAHRMNSAALQLCPYVPQYTNLPAAMGAMYVTEGATLGGQFLVKRIEANLGMTNGYGYSFFAGYREQTSKMWNEFKHILEAMCASDPQAAADSAVSTFLCIERWLMGSAC